jgi:hypothetical protein
VRIVGHKTSGAIITLTVQVSGAGRLTVGGRGVAAAHRTLAHAQRLSLKLHITRAAGAALNRRHRLRLTLRASLAAASGGASVASATVTLV